MTVTAVALSHVTPEPEGRTASNPPKSDELTDDPTVVLLTVEEAARRLRIGRTVCYRLISSGELESITVGGLRRVPTDAVPEFVDRRRRQSSRPVHAVAV